MKKYIILLTLVCGLFLTQNCKVKQYEPFFDFHGTVSAEDSSDYVEAGENGFELYKKFCGNCHGINTKGQKGIPNFTNEQLEDYNLRWQMGQGSSHIGLDELSDNQLDNILIFLQYRKRDK